MESSAYRQCPLCLGKIEIRPGDPSWRGKGVHFNGTKRCKGSYNVILTEEQYLAPLPKPKAVLVGKNGNIYNLLAIASRALMEVKQFANLPNMKTRVVKSHSYDEALNLIMEYVDVQ